MNQQDISFITDPRISRISEGNCESTVINVLADRFNFNANKFSYINCNTNYLKADYTNIRSVLNKFYINLNNIDLFFLTETCLTNKVNDATVCPSSFNIYQNDRFSRGGGVAVIFFFPKECLILCSWGF